MNVLFNIVKRELASYFSTPLAYVFIVIFLALIGSFTFYLGNFFVRGQADLNSFFAFHPWVYILLIPAVTMRLWAEERKSGTSAHTGWGVLAVLHVQENLETSCASPAHCFSRHAPMGRRDAWRVRSARALAGCC